MNINIREALEAFSNILVIGVFVILVIIIILIIIGLIIIDKTIKKPSKEYSLGELVRRIEKTEIIDKITDILLTIVKVSIVIALGIKLLI